MPVPVPARAPAHPVNKVPAPDALPSGLVKKSALKHLLNSLPEPPSGPPPAFTDRETWIKSLPPSRRYKVRQDVATIDSGAFPVIAIQAHKVVVKNQPTLPDMSSSIANVVVRNDVTTSLNLQPASLGKVMHAPLSNGKPWPPSPPKSIKQAIKADERRKAALDDAVLACESSRDGDDELSEDWTEDEAFFAGPTIHRQTSIKKVAILEENKENVDCAIAHSNSSEPLCGMAQFDSDTEVPIAPFDSTLSGEATTQVPDTDTKHRASPPSPEVTIQAKVTAHISVEQSDQSGALQTRKALTPIPTTITPSDMATYKKKVAEPMSEWLAGYIWKVVTHGMSLPPHFIANETSYGKSTRAYASQPPAYLGDSIRTLLCSTLLQPSAIFLAMWYIARLPVFFGVFVYDAKTQSKEFKFRLELLGEGSTEPGAEKSRQLLEAHAPFRLLLLGVMLANKWLDDNTFSNKTWHQVSGIPMRALNRLESLGLDILCHDLSMLPRAWEQWLEHMQNYHRSLAPYPEPIGPPKETPHVVIRRTIEELIAAGSPPRSTGVLPEPIFLGLEERRREREKELLAKEELDLLSLDLDEDGPLREEYLPKRYKDLTGTNRDKKLLERTLPPPAEWSPAADPPIHRTRPTYQAVQRPPPAPVLAHARAHVEPARVPQANGYFNRIEFTLPEAPDHMHVQGHMHHRSQGWPGPEELCYQVQIERLPFPHHVPHNYPSVYNVQYPAAVATQHSTSWSVPAPFMSLPPSAGYQPSSAFDAPPPSELFRPTWLRT